MPRAFLLSAALLAACGTDETISPASSGGSGDEAGFIELGPITYAVHHQGIRTELTSSAARIFYAFQTADDAPEDKPLAVFWNGGPGAATGILLGYNTAKRSLDPAFNGGGVVGADPASWSRFANLLYIDARGTGFSYGRVEGVEDEVTRQAEFGARNYNPWIDGADFVRVVLRFLRAHPALESRPVVLVGESYGGIRAAVFLELLLHHASHGDGATDYEDPALVEEVQAHFGAAAGAEIVAAQFGRQVLLQPRLSTPHQQAAAGAAFEGPQSPLLAVAAETGQPFVPCDQKPAPCSAYENAIAYLGIAGRDMYDLREPAGSTLAGYDAIAPALSSPGPLSAALGVELGSVADLGAAGRKDAYRLVVGALEDEPLAGVLGDLAPWDRYFRIQLFDAIGAPFAGAEAQSLGIDRRDVRWGGLFLDDLRYVQTFVTNASNDAVIYTPALAEALAMYRDRVSGVAREPGQLRVRYLDGAERLLRFPAYPAAGHSVTVHQPLEVAEDVEAWLAE